MYLVIAPRQASTGEFIHCFSEQIREKNLSYPIGGMGAMPRDDPSPGEDGPKHATGAVVQIVVENGKATGETIPEDDPGRHHHQQQWRHKESVYLAGRLLLRR